MSPRPRSARPSVAADGALDGAIASEARRLGIAGGQRCTTSSSSRAICIARVCSDLLRSRRLRRRAVGLNVKFSVRPPVPAVPSTPLRAEAVPKRSLSANSANATSGPADPPDTGHPPRQSRLARLGG